MPKFAEFPIKKHLKNWKRAISRCSRRQRPRSQGRNIWPRWNSGTMSTTTCWRCCHCQSMTFWTCSAAALRWTPSSRICTAPCRPGWKPAANLHRRCRAPMISMVFPDSTAVKTVIGACPETADCLSRIVLPKGISKDCSAVRRLVENAAMYGCPVTRTNAGKTAVRSIHVERERMGGSISRAMSTAQPLPSQRGRSRAIPRAVCPMERFTYAHLGSMQSSTFPRPSVHCLWNVF